MNEWSFVTADQHGNIISIDGNRVDEHHNVTVSEMCEENRWDIEHSHFAILNENWYLILSRPYAHKPPNTAAYTASHHPLAAAVGGTE